MHKTSGPEVPCSNWTSPKMILGHCRSIVFSCKISGGGKKLNKHVPVLGAVPQPEQHSAGEEETAANSHQEAGAGQVNRSDYIGTVSQESSQPPGDRSRTGQQVRLHRYSVTREQPATRRQEQVRSTGQTI